MKQLDDSMAECRWPREQVVGDVAKGRILAFVLRAMRSREEESKHESDVLNLGITRVYSDYTVENRLRETRVNAEGLVRNLMR